MGSHLFTPRSGLNLGIRMRKTYIFLHDWLDDCLVGWLTVCLVGWFAGWLFGWLVGWLAVGRIVCLVD
jgi:hypothetical protein